MDFERVVLAGDSLRVEVIPALGGKISSMRLLSDDEELLQQPLRPYAERTRTMAFSEGEASGIDECIPTVSGCEVGAKVFPDHGDFWRVPFLHRLAGDSLHLEAEGFSLPLRFEKRLTLRNDRLIMEYTVRNIGEESTPYIWSAHPGFAVEAGDRVVLPPSVAEITVWYSGSSRLGPPGRAHSWPRTRDANGDHLDLSLAGGANDGIGDKIFAVAPVEGWVALERRRLGRRIEVRFDPGKVPYVGLWLAYGGWPEGAVRRQHCVALEPCTAPVDSLAVAIERGWQRVLAPGESWLWQMEIRITS